MKIIITEQQYNNAIDKFLTYQFEPYEIIRSGEHPKTVLFWIKEGKIIAEIQRKKIFLLNHTISDEISNMFGLEFNEIKNVIREWLKIHTNMDLEVKYDDLPLY